MRRTSMTVMATMLAVGLLAGPALAQGPDRDKGRSLERGNWLSGVAEPVELDAGDVTFNTLGDTEYVTVRHNIGEFDTLVQREPARYKQNVVDEEGGDFDAAWLGIAGPNGPDIDHKGKLQWYYETADGDWVSLNFQFNGNGELVHVNGVSPQ